MVCRALSCLASLRMNKEAPDDTTLGPDQWALFGRDTVGRRSVVRISQGLRQGPTGQDSETRFADVR